MSDSPNEERSGLKRYLNDQEKLIWTGSAKASLRDSSEHQALVRLFWAFALVLAVSLILMVLNDETDMVRTRGYIASGSTLEGILLVLFVIPSAVGAGITGIQLVRAWFSDVTSLYAITDRRLLVASRLPAAVLASYEKADLSEVRLVQHSTTASLYFVPKPSAIKPANAKGFMRLADAEKAGTIIEQAHGIRVVGLQVSSLPSAGVQSGGTVIKGARGATYDLRDEVPALRRKGYSNAQIKQVVSGRMTREDLLAVPPDNQPDA